MSLLNLNTSQSFANDAITSSVRIDLGTLTTTEALQEPVALTIRYDAPSNSYTVSRGGLVETFGPDALLNPPYPGQTDYGKFDGVAEQFYTLTAPGTAENLGIVYVGGAYWQRNTETNGVLDIGFDVAAYGFDTAADAMPRTGAAGYRVNLFGFFAPPDRTPKVVAGAGDFSVDFLNGLFMTEGGATEFDLTDPYYTGEHEWRGGGTLNSTNGFSGGFYYGGRERFNTTGEITGRFYGPLAQEVGAVFRASDGAGTILTGTLLGVASDSIDIPPMTVLPDGADRSYHTLQGNVPILRLDGVERAESAAAAFPGSYGQIIFESGGNIQATTERSSATIASPVFSTADRVPAESGNAYTTYSKVHDGNQYKLVLLNPGPSNEELALTYAGFGRWQQVRREANRTETLNTWFAYGAPPVDNSILQTGTASYSMTVHGNGITFEDGFEYDLGGAASMSLDFSTMLFSGNLDTVASQIGGAAVIDFDPLIFEGTMTDGYSFESFLFSSPGHAPGSIRGRLFGPNGEEVAVAFDFVHRLVEGGHAIGYFGGVAIGKKD